MKRRKRLRRLATAALVLDLLSLPLAPVRSRQRYVDPRFVHLARFFRIFRRQTAARRKLRETGRNEG